MEPIRDSMEILNGVQMIMQEIGAIGKNSRNTMQGFNFRGIDDVMNVLHPLLTKAHVVIVPTVIDVTREERQNARGTTLIYSVARVRYTFMSTVDGSTIETEVIGEGMDSGDKSINKAMSIAMKYACFQIFCIPTEEMVDPDAESHQVAPKKPEYPQEFVDACKMKAGGSTLGKLYKENKPLYENLRNTGSDAEKAAIAIIDKYMEDRK